MSHTRKWILIFSMLILAACAQQAPEQPTGTGPNDANNQPTSEPDNNPTGQPPALEPTKVITPGGIQRPAPTFPRTPDFTRPTPPFTPDLVQPTVPLSSGEIPQELIDKMLDDLAAQLGIDRQDIAILAAESLIWNDGSLGCPKPGVFYTQALVPGYRVILEADGIPYNYHASEKGYFFLCQSPKLGPGSPPSGLTPDR